MKKPKLQSQRRASSPGGYVPGVEKALQDPIVGFHESDLAEHQKIREALPDRKKLIEEFGESSYESMGKDSAGRDKWRINLNSKAALAKALEMLSPADAIDRERQHRIAAGRSTTTLKNKDTGQTIEAWSSLAESIARQRGLVEKTYWGRPSYRKVYNS